MKNIYKFSIIIPYYNPPMIRFEACINSLISQDYPDYELIFVDDGSETRYKEIVENKCENSCTDFLFLRQDNRGVSIARNEGTKAATGDYIIYIDADDEMPPGVLTAAAEVLESKAFDVVLGYVKYVTCESDKTVGASSQKRKVSFPKALQLGAYHLTGKSSEIVTILADGSVLKIGPVARLVKREIAQITPFPERVPISEDTLWSLQIFDKAKSIALVSETWYWYWVTHKSASRGYNPNAKWAAIKFRDAFERIIKQLTKKPPQGAVCLRLLGEINRAVKSYYAHPDCPHRSVRSVREIRALTKEMNINGALSLRNAMSEGPIATAKYLLCASGLSLFYWKFTSQFE